MQQSRLNDRIIPEEKEKDPVSEDIDVLVSNFLGELANISSDERGTRPTEAIENQPVEQAQVEAIEKQSVETLAESVPEGTVAAQAEESLAGLRIDFDSINREIEESLSELERLRSKVVPVADRRDTKADPAANMTSAESSAESPVVERPVVNTPAAERAAGIPVTRPAVLTGAKIARLPESPEAEDQAQKRLGNFRSQVVSRESRRGPKPALVIAIVTAILAVPAYQLFKQRLTPNTRNPAASSAGQPASLESDVSKGRVRAESIIKVLPTYPTLPKRQRFAGTVMLEADIDENGSVVRARAISGPNQLRKAAEEALMKWKFRPASFNGIAVASKERIPIVLEPPR